MLLCIDELRISLRGDATALVDGASLRVERGALFALVGESGSGKSLTAMAVPRLLADDLHVTGGRIELDGVELLARTQRELRAIRGARIGVVFQEPMTSLNPLLTVGAQIAEPLMLHKRLRASAARRETLALLRRVGVAAPEQRAGAYPHQLSGGMRQRVLIAAAIACRPDLLIADEPTTALDVCVQAQILALLRELQRESGMGVLLITHDLAVVAQCAERAAVMYAGRIVEAGPVGALFAGARHPYTRALLRSLPQPVDAAAGARPSAGRAALPVIPGEVADPWTRPGGCAFHPRCDLGRDLERCRRERPVLETFDAGHEAACWEAAHSR